MSNRLPIPGSDNGTWGDVLNAYLEVSLASDGTLNANVVGSSQIQNDAVGTSQIANNAVTNAQLDSPTQTTLASVSSKYTKPAGGIPSSDMTSAVQTSLGKADSSIQASELGAANGIATLDGSSTLTSSQLPSSVVNASSFLAPSGGDDAAAMQSAINAITGAGTIILGPGVFLWNSAVPTLPRNTAIRIIGSGRDKTTIRLSSGAPQAFAFHKIADHDLFQGIELADFTVDGNNVGGLGHVLIGTFATSGATLSRVQIDQLALRRITVMNVPSNSSTGTYNTTTLHRYGVSLLVAQSAANEATEDFITNVTCEQLRLIGGDSGVVIGATGVATVGMNVYIDQIILRDCFHTTGAVATQTYTSSNFQVGSRGFGGDCVIENCKGLFSGDVGIEVDSMERAHVVGWRMEDAFNACYFITNFNYPAIPGGTGPSSSNNTLDSQEFVIERCHARRITQVNSAKGYRVDVGSIALGAVRILGSTYYRNAADFGGEGEMIMINATMNEVVIDNFGGTVEGINIAGGAASASHLSIVVDNTSGPAMFRARSINLIYGGTNASANTQTLYAISFGGSIGHPVTSFDIDDVSIAGTLSGWVGAIYGVAVGNAGSFTGQGTIRALRWTKTTGMPGASGLVRIGGKTLLTIPTNARILIADCDAQKNPIPGGAGNSIQFASGGGTNQAQTLRLANAYAVTSPVDAAKAPVTITPASTGAWQQNTQGCDGTLVVSGGTVTSIAISHDGSTSQSTGLTAGPIPWPNGQYWQWNGSGAPSECVFMPSNP